MLFGGTARFAYPKIFRKRTFVYEGGTGRFVAFFAAGQAISYCGLCDDEKSPAAPLCSSPNFVLTFLLPARNC